MFVKQVGSGFFRVQAVLAVALVVVFVAAQPPQVRRLALAETSTQAQPYAAFVPTVWEGADGTLLRGTFEAPVPLERLIPRTRSVVDVRIGPSSNYAIIGLMPGSAAVEIVGRDESGEWLAVVFTTGSSFNGWIERSKVANLRDVASLPIASVTRLAAH